MPSAFEMVGHIAHLNLRDEHLPYKKLIAKASFWIGCLLCIFIFYFFTHIVMNFALIDPSPLLFQVVLDKHSSKIRTVVNKIDAIQNTYRTMELEVLAGNHSLVATVVENGLRFQVDLATVYSLFS